MSNIQNTYYDALYFSTASFNTKEAFALTPVQKDVLIKLIHYSTKNEVITWSSENIHNHTCIPVGSIDKAIQRLKQKGYITVINKQLSQTVVSRQITINWEKIEEIDSMYKNWIENKTIQSVQDVVIKEESVIEEVKTIVQEKESVVEDKKQVSIKEKLIKNVKKRLFNEDDEAYLIRRINAEEIETIADIDEASANFFTSNIENNEDEITFG